MSKNLSEHLSDRENNFTAIRLLLAWMVLYGHSYAITSIPGVRDPVTVFLRSTWIGEIAVNCFFAISGLLITRSYVRNSPASFIVSRILRIMPALIICIFVSVYIFGPFYTTLPLNEYFLHSETLSYLKNVTLTTGLQWELPGVFANNAETAVNGSLWTLPIEVRCYIMCITLGILGAFRSRTVTFLVAGMLVYIALQDWNILPLFEGRVRSIRLASYFLIGAMAFQWRKDIPIHPSLFILSIIVFLLARGTDQFDVLSAIPVVYMILYIAFGLPHLDLDRYLGDISYGAYIYAFPVQQMIMTSFPGSGPIFNCIVSTPIVFLLAYISWRLIEKPSILLKRPVMNRLSNLWLFIRPYIKSIHAKTSRFF